jgi:hypothetical protein
MQVITILDYQVGGDATWKGRTNHLKVFLVCYDGNSDFETKG